MAITQGIRVTVRSRFLPEQSKVGRWAFAYTVRIENLGTVAAQLKSRHWVITDGNGRREEVRGDGVVGNQPVLRPGENFEYTSGAILQTPHGSMQGTYRMVAEDGRSFDACLSSNRTCEAALQQVTGRPYASFVLALEQLTR